MATVRGTASVNPNEDSYSFTLENVEKEWIAPVFEEKALVLPDGEPDLDENGQPKTEQVLVTSGRSETLEEATKRTFIAELMLDELVASLSNLRVEIDFTVRGSVELDLEEYELADYGFEDVSPDDIDSYVIQENLRDVIEDVIRDELSNGFGWGNELEWDVNDWSAE